MTMFKFNGQRDFDTLFVDLFENIEHQIKQCLFSLAHNNRCCISVDRVLTHG